MEKLTGGPFSSTLFSDHSIMEKTRGTDRQINRQNSAASLVKNVTRASTNRQHIRSVQVQFSYYQTRRQPAGLVT